jgi:hypothetical protein
MFSMNDINKIFNRFVEVVGTRKAVAIMMRAIGKKIVDEHNPVLPWILERCVSTPGVQMDCGLAHADFVRWNGGTISKKAFGSYLRDTGMVIRVSARGVPSGSVYRGICLLE